MSRKLDEVPPDQIPEVQELIEARQMLEDFEAQHPQIMKHREDLIGQYNVKLEAADKAVRARGVSCDQIIKYQEQEKTNPEVVYEWGGREIFIKSGGGISKKTVLTLDKARFRASVASGDVPEEVAERAIVKTPRYHTPKPRT